MRHPGGTPKRKMGPCEMNSKMVVVVVGPSLNVELCMRILPLGLVKM